MRHFDFLSEADRRRLFFHEPEHLSLSGDPGLLAEALGATLYSPGVRAGLARDIARQVARGVMSVVVCLEDAIADVDLRDAERNAVAQLRRYEELGNAAPLVFVRVRSAAQIGMIVAGLGRGSRVLTGFVVPKFTEESGSQFLEAVVEASEQVGRCLFVMPVLESPEMIFAESRIAALRGARRLLDKYREHVLAVRLGATDLSAVYGLRRSRDITIYDVRVVADAISDVINIFGRAADDGYVVTGPVWEYFAGVERIFKPQLRESPFAEHSEPALRARLITDALDGLIREVVLDKANGLSGKTVIHPSHVAAVHALSVVTHEEYSDAADVLGTGAAGGVAASLYRNKMNESKPHAAWAGRIMRRARVFGVARDDVSFVDLLGAALCQ
jgi:citrate lyase beta subunit